jgi:hypothetical protein
MPGSFALPHPRLLDQLADAFRMCGYVTALRQGHVDWARSHYVACAAALADFGQDANRLCDKERARLRKQALDWLRADLAAWRCLLEKGPAQNRPAIAQQLAHWLEDTDLSGVRGPEAERGDWQRLWADVAATLARAQAKPAPEKKPDLKPPPAKAAAARQAGS